MRLLEIEGISGSKYKLRELKSTNRIVLSIDFFKLDYQVQVGDYLVLADCLIDKRSESYCPFYCFSTDMENGCGRKVENFRIDEEGDLAIIIGRNKRGMVLKRLYG